MRDLSRPALQRRERARQLIYDPYATARWRAALASPTTRFVVASHQPPI
jgi:hypothetical protein